MSKKEFRKLVGFVLCGLPLAGVVVADFLPISARAEQFLVLIALIWFETFILLEVLFTAR